MSTCYWMNEGIGVRDDKLYPHLDKQKCFRVISKELPELDIKMNNFNLDDYMFDPFMNIGDFMCHVDDTGLMSYGDNGDGTSYFLYSPSYPWQRKENEPQSIEEVHKIIVKAIMKVTNLTAKEAEKLIEDDIYEYGCG